MHARLAAALYSSVVPILAWNTLPLCALAQDQLSARQVRQFESTIRPVLVEHCYDCHSSEVDEPGGGLILDHRLGLRKGGNGGPAVVPGRPNSSLILLAMKHAETDLIMPPADYGEKLPDNVISDFERWIRDGAPDPRRPAHGDGEQTEERWKQTATPEHWAWKAPAAPSAPELLDDSGARTEIDRFVIAALQQAQLTPSPPADRLQLIRRLAIDLTGLPPKPEDLQEFALAEHPNSVEAYVDKLLASEWYGERFGRHWLDVARYAESSGKDVNVSYPHAWRYRDYVIDAFNADLPFDDFIQQQLAGDLLPADDDEDRRTKLIATGFLSIGPKSVNEMNPYQFAIDVADEQIDAVSQAFLGVTISCARCHDHKFDPISQTDYTALAGIFLSTETHFGTSGGVAGRNRSSLLTLPPSKAEESMSRQLSPQELADLDDRINELESERRELVLARRANRDDASQAMSALRISQQLVQLNLQRDSVDEKGNPLPQAMGVSEKPPVSRFGRFFQQRSRRNRPTGGGRLVARQLDNIQDSPLLVRGEIDKPGETVPRGLPAFLAGDDLSRSGTIKSNESGRQQLAEWIASPQNPLTARVIVNRVWSWIMGEGLVATEDNFGTSGETPSNPELLDALTIDFIDSGWSIKTLVRKIVLSSTYQQSSAYRHEAFQVDPGNRLHWRSSKRALDAESLRDGMLAISGRLNYERPNASIVAQAGDGLIGGRRGRGLSEETITTANPNVRSVYLPAPRNVLPDSLQLFDFADNSRVAGDRELTIVPSQALYWMNSPSVEDQCEEIALTVLGEHGKNAMATPTQVDQGLGGTRRMPPRLPNRLSERASRSSPSGRTTLGRGKESSLTKQEIEDVFQDLTLKVLSRPPLAAETRAAVGYVQERQRNGKSQRSIWTGVTRSLFSSAEYRFLL